MINWPELKLDGLPTEAGLYWYEDDPEQDPYGVFGEWVKVHAKRSPEELWVKFLDDEGLEYRMFSDQFPGTFYGPVPQPHAEREG